MIEEFRVGDVFTKDGEMLGNIQDVEFLKKYPEIQKQCERCPFISKKKK